VKLEKQKLYGNIKSTDEKKSANAKGGTL